MKVYFNENGEFLKATGSSIFAESENSDVLELKLPMALANSVVYTTFLLPFPEDSEQYGNYKAESLLMTLTVDEQDGGIMWRGVLSAGYLVNSGIAYLSARVATQNGTIVKTTEQVKFEIGAGGAYQATPILPEQAEQLAEAITQLQADVLDLQTDKQDKVDYSINLEQFPLENTVVGAINSLGEQVKTNTDNIETNTQDIATNRNDIDEIKQTMSTGENPIGTMTGSELPTDMQLNAFVEDNTTPSRAPLVGDVVIFVLELAEETDKNYKYYYRGTAKGWAYYEIPPIEKASNVAYGILRGTYTVGATADTLVDISGGEIIAIWVKDTTVVPTQYRRVNDYANSLQTQIRAIINGSQVVGKSTRAVQDESGNNIVDTYLTKANGASKLFVKDYALPRIFNDVYYLALGGYQKTVPTTPASGVQFETTTSAVGSFELFTAERQNSSDFEVSAKNSSSNNIYVSANRDVGVRFRMTTQVSIQGGAWQTASVELTNKYTLDNGEIVKVPFSSFFNALGDTVLDLTTGDKFRQKLEVVTEESESTTFSVYSSETYPSSLNLNISSMSIIVAQGELGEQPTNVANGTKANETITFELLDSSKLNNNTECLFTFNFDGELVGTDEVIAQYNGNNIRLITPYNIESGNPTIDEFNELMSKYDEQAGYSWEFKGFVKNDNNGIIIIVDMPNLHDIKEDIDDLYTEIESIDNRVTTNEGNITTLQGDVGNLQTGLSGAVADIESLQTNKQDKLSQTQLSAVDSGITSTLVGKITTNETNITTLQTSKQNTITSSNKLSADLVDDTNTTNKFVTSADKTKLSNALVKADVIDSVTSTVTDKPLSANMGKELQDQIDNQKTIGKYLSQWNCVTGLPVTNPPTDPYTYHTGDYYRVGTIASAGGTNYKPNGTQYIAGTPSTTVETETDIKIDDIYFYDGTNWTLQRVIVRDVAFSNITGNATDNTSLANALSGKLNKITSTSSTNQAYVKGSDGSQMMVEIAQSVMNGTIPLRSSTGTLKVATPSSTEDATTKQYVDTALSSKQDLIDNDNKLSADLVSDTSTTNKFVSSAEKSTWNGKQDALSATQLSAVNSGANTTNIGQIATNVSAISALQSGKQDNLTSAQLNAVNSGITNTLVGKITTNETNITTLQTSKQNTITSSNKLSADLTQDGTTNKVFTATEKTKLSELANTPIATTSVAGKVKPDGTSIIVDADGTIHAQSSGVAWGTITGTLSNQTDLQNALDGKQNNITSSNKLSADLVDDTSSANKFVTSAEKSTWNGKQNALDATQLNAVNSGANTTNIGQIATNTSAISALQSGKQDTITSNNKLSADLTQDGTTNKVFTATEKTKLSGIESGAQVNTVSSVNSKTGAVSLSASDVGALPSTTTYVSSVNGSSGAVTDIAKTDLSNVTYPTLTADGVERTGSGDRVIKSKISSDGKSWYRVWASGWKECGMVGQYKSTWALLVFALPITFSNTNYVITFGRTTNNYTGYAGLMCNGYSNKTTSGFSTYADSGYPLEVYCCGY